MKTCSCLKLQLQYQLQGENGPKMCVFFDEYKLRPPNYCLFPTKATVTSYFHVFESLPRESR